MKKLIIISLFGLLLLGSSLGVAFAQDDMTDPVLCVAGQWLMVDAATPEGVVVVLPAGTPFGEDGSCTTDPPQDSQYITQVTTLPMSGPNMIVIVDGKLASVPTVTVAYGDKSFDRRNVGQVLFFRFQVPRH